MCLKHVTGIKKMLKGVVQYRHTDRLHMLDQFKKIKDDPHPTSVLFTCIDSRLQPNHFFHSNIGEMFVVRNAGNLVPHESLCDPYRVTTEPAALELGCIVNHIYNIMVLGHSDCKAMNALYTACTEGKVTDMELRQSPLLAWVYRHGYNTVEKLKELEERGLDQSLQFETEIPMRKMVAYIDPENKFAITDKLSQISCLQQVENIASYKFLKKGLQDGTTRIHAAWFDIYTGNVHYFSRREKRFVEITDDSVDQLMKDCDM